MSRVDEALARAAATPRLPATSRQIAEQAAEQRDRSVLEHYPYERPPLAPPAGRDQTRTRSADDTGHLPDRAASGRVGEAYRGKLVTSSDAIPACIEQYRRLAAALHHLQVGEGLKRLMVSSALPQEGKTLTVVNLAMTLSESYKRRVLLIDADLRRPSIHEVFGISNKYGLCDALRSDPREIKLSRVSQMLWVLPAGSPPGANPMAALASQRMELLLDAAGSSFDWILLDAPPVALMADAGLLARLTRAVIFVIGAGFTPYALVEKAVAELGREHVIGTVLNRVEGDATQWSAYYSGYDQSTRSSKPLGANIASPPSGTKVQAVPPLKSPDTKTSDTMHSVSNATFRS